MLLCYLSHTTTHRNVLFFPSDIIQSHVRPTLWADGVEDGDEALALLLQAGEPGAGHGGDAATGALRGPQNLWSEKKISRRMA